VRQERSRPRIVELEAWLREQRANLSRNNNTTSAINYGLSVVLFASHRCARSSMLVIE
jgi:transposase